MKRCKTLGFALLLLILSAVLLWKFPIYCALNSIQLPEGCETLQTKVVYSDVYEPHILGERVVITELDQFGLADFIGETNPEWLVAQISIFPFFTEWDERAVSPYDYEMQVAPADRGAYFVIRYYQTIRFFR